MKKLTLIISALALVLGLSQCTKPNQPNLGKFDKVTKTITFNVNGGDGQKGDFIQQDGQLLYQWDNINDNDVIYAYIQTGGTKFTSGQFLGKMRMTSLSDDKLKATFEGTFTYEFPDNGWIRFIHYGKSVSFDEVNGNTNGFVDFSTQQGTTEFISDNVIAKCDMEINEEQYYDECAMEVQFAVIYVNLSNLYENLADADNVKMLNISQTGLKVNVDGTFEYNTKNNITLGKENLDHYYLVVMPETAKTHHTFFDNLSEDKVCCLEGKTEVGKFYSDNNNPILVELLPKGSLPGAFSIPGGKEVHFSKGNLQYLPNNGSTEGEKWRFALNQYDFLGDGSTTGNTTVEGHTHYNFVSYTDAARDLFGWGCTGYQDDRISHSENKQKYYQPYNYEFSDDEYSPYNYFGYGPDWTHSNPKTPRDLSVANKSDWGCLDINGNGAGLWRTMTSDEFGYIFGISGSRSCAYLYAPARIEHATGKYTNGLLVFPDTWMPVEGITIEYNDATKLYSTNTLTLAEWSSLENLGAVFMPAAGRRGDNTKALHDGLLPVEVGTACHYYTSTAVTTADGQSSPTAKAVRFNKSENGSGLCTLQKGRGRRFGEAVRLVCDK